MRLLVDGDVLLQWFDGSSRLSTDATAEIRRGSNEVFVSVATLWDLAVRQSQGGLPVEVDLRQHAREQLFEELPILGEHVTAVRTLPRRHDDAFGRMLVAQARCEGLVLVTSDRRLAGYDVPIMFA